MLDALELAVASGSALAALGLAVRALYTFCRSAVAATHGATSGVQRLRALRLRLYTLMGLLGVVLGGLAVWQSSLVPGSALWPAGTMLVFGFFADVSARASGRASMPGDKRAHVEARMRAHAYRKTRRHREGYAAEEQKQQHRHASRKRSRRRSAHGRSSGEDASGERSSRRRGGRRSSGARAPSERRRALHVLGLPEGAGHDEVKRAWRRHAFRHHPDRHVSAPAPQRAEHERAFHRARRAYETLRDHPDD